MTAETRERSLAGRVPPSVALVAAALLLGGCATPVVTLEASRHGVSDSQASQVEPSEAICGSTNHIDYDGTAGEPTAREAIMVWVSWLRSRIADGLPANEEYSAPAQLLVLENALAAMDRGEIDRRTGADGVIPINDNTGAEVGVIDIDPTTAGYVLSMVGENSSPCDDRLVGEQ